MDLQCFELHGVRVAEISKTGDQLRTDRQAIEIISEASACQPELIVIPVERLSDEFLHLKTRVAGEVLQKFVTYRKRGKGPTGSFPDYDRSLSEAARRKRAERRRSVRVGALRTKS